MAKQKKWQALFRSIGSEQASAAPVLSAQPSAAGIPPEIVAALSGAIAVLCGERAQVVSITRARREKGARSAWMQAAIAEITHPF